MVSTSGRFFANLSALNESLTAQFHLDFRTGRPSVITGDVVSDAARSACGAINRERTRGIKEATRPAASGEPFQADGWHALVARKAAQWGVPLIPLTALGISFDRDRLFVSRFLQRLGWGAEAIAWADVENRCVYKLFEVHPNAALGKRLVIEQDHEGAFRAIHANADLDTTMEKLAVLHDAGGCPTEIVGVADSGDYLIVKQPLCVPFENFLEDRRSAAESLKAVVPKYSLGREIRVFWLRDQAWCIGDLHEGNIMRDVSGRPTIIDALICPLPPFALKQAPHLLASVERARAWREGVDLPPERDFCDVPDDEL